VIGRRRLQFPGAYVIISYLGAAPLADIAGFLRRMATA
jgi:hypothetical protein